MKNPTVKEMKKRLDKLAQTCCKWRGAYYRDGRWWNRCVTSNKILPMEGKNSLQGGHFIPRGVIPLRWHPMNIHAQSPRDNGFRNGAYIEYSKFFIDTYGIDAYNDFMDIYGSYKRGEFHGYNVSEIAKMYNEWLDKGRDLEGKIGRQLFPKTWGKYIMKEDRG